MTMQTDHHGNGLGDNLGAQLTLTTTALIAVVVIAWFYVF
jgi:hypothetical protein